MPYDPDLPLLAYKFAVVITSGLLPNPVDIRFQEVSGLSIKRSINYENGMITTDGKQQTQTLTLKRGVVPSNSPLTLGNMTETLFWDTRLLRKDILVSVVDEDNDPVNSWLITNAYLDTWQWDNLNATSNAVLIESMSFTYTGIKYISL